MDSTVTLLKDLIIGASISLSPAVAWLTFFSSWREKRRNRLAALRQRLLELNAEIEHIGNWASSEYEETSSHNDNWRNPFWRVNDFPSNHLEHFNREVNPSEVGRDLSEAMLQLEASISRFRTMLTDHQQFVRTGLETWARPLQRETQGFVFSLPDDWQQELYNRNRDIHIRGIATSHDPDGLHSTWARASDQLRIALNQLRQPRDPKSMYFGHFLAIFLGVVGLGFLFSFVLEVFFEFWK
jgi:hypothetical protein